MDAGPFEIERKFLIRMPERELLRKASCTEITQTYLLSEGEGRARVRKRGRDGNYIYTYTVKKRVNDLRRVEREREIGEEEYSQLLKRADPERRVIRKQRWCLPYRGQMFEIDIFPFWSDRALMEIELRDEDQPVDFPPEIQILREVTADRRYTNAALAKYIPEEDEEERTRE